MTSASRAKRGLSGTATSASGKEGIGRRRALDKNKSLSVDCLGDSLSAGGVKQASAENTRASAPTSTSSSSLVDELDMLLGCGVIPHQPSILAASEAPAHGAVSTHLADHAVLGDVYGTPQVESDAAAAIIVDMILGQGEGHAHHHAPVAAASAHCGSGPRDATPAPEWDPLDWLTGGSAQNAPSSVSSGPVATGWVADKENTAPAPHSASHGATGTESRRIGDAAKAAHESAVGMVEWDIDRILMGS
ncbi:hypothetical protein BCR44DRAFT_1429219 [Catenaria anguillulae PL171]|uniref:Uncharacterized protein n=1 Tax=Catenaria anguillulae PL171 TaxID=765915 RepID=A0A1Y2HTG2_9FUNG|nr:hypothetical protein BCR44DRAFT_1429219 [Catenaria anguillulae PL171]